MNPSEIADFFDARAPRYVHDDWHRRYAEAFVAAVPLRRGDYVLDAGTGTGFAACAAASRVGPQGRVLAVDLSAGMLEQARATLAVQNVQNVELLRADATDLRQLAAGTLDAVVCAAGLLYMPVAKALGEWHRLLKPGGIVAFSTMRAASPSAGHLFRQCAAEFGLSLDDPSEPLGSEDRCRHALGRAGFDTLDVVAARVDFGAIDLTLAWEANLRAPGHAAARGLTPDEQQALQRRYFDALRHAIGLDPAAASRADVLFAIGRQGPGRTS